MIKSILDDIPGVGPVKKKILYDYFRDINEIKNASIDDLKKIDGIDKKIAENIYNHFHQ